MYLGYFVLLAVVCSCLGADTENKQLPINKGQQDVANNDKSIDDVKNPPRLKKVLRNNPQAEAPAAAGAAVTEKAPAVRAPVQQAAEENKDEQVKETPPPKPRRKHKKVYRRLKKKRKQHILLRDTQSCGADIQRLCSERVAKNNFAALNCLQTDEKTASSVSADCQHLIWQYKHNLTTDTRFGQLLNGVCESDFNNLTDCKRLDARSGQRISCMIENKNEIKSRACLQFLHRMEPIVFSDYRLIYKFVDTCKKDIKKFHCGRLGKDTKDPKKDPDDDEEDKRRFMPSSQGKTIECLFDKLNDNEEQLSPDCQHEILRVAELQSDDFHSDRALFYACREDRESLCPKVVAGEGKVLQCLIQHKFDDSMTEECREQIVKRQKLAQKDYKVDNDFFSNCEADITRHKCHKTMPSSKNADTRLAHVQLCLESRLKDSQEALSTDCTTALLRLRQELMEDYKLSPEIVRFCEQDIKSHCPHGTIQKGGATLHCLMKLRQDRPGEESVLKAQCQRAVEGLVKLADPSSDVRVDPIIQEACASVIHAECSDLPRGEGKIYQCLLSKMGNSEHMTEECDARLTELQYIISRDFTLSDQLYRACKKDAKKLCSAPDAWHQSPVRDNTPARGPVIFNCLYKHMTDTDEHLQKPTSKCSHEIRRVLHYRAVKVSLEPRIYEPCIQDLAKFCMEQKEKGQEINCLQDNTDNLSKNCKAAVIQYAKEVDKDVSLDRILVKSCAPMISKFCENEMTNNEGEPGEVMQCLIRHKNNPDMNVKCKAGIEHHQLIGLKDYTISYRFAEGCKTDIVEYCKGGETGQTKAKVVQCLSEIMRNDTLLDKKHRLSLKCRKELRFELLQRSENIKLDPELHRACNEDQRKFCPKEEYGHEQVIKCLKSHQEDLSDKCHRIIFIRERADAIDIRTDERVMRVCRNMIYTHCDKIPDKSRLLSCLRQQMHDPEFDKKCRKVIYRRLLTRSKDYRLDPRLERRCKKDIGQYCSKEIAKAKNAKARTFHEFNGVVIHCLKKAYTKDKLSDKCTAHIRGVIIESNLNYHLDPILRKACHFTLLEQCIQELEGTDTEDGDGHVTECIKRAFIQKKLNKKDKNCNKEVARLVSEGHADVHVDPLLYRSCAVELRTMCRDVQLGGGRQMSCLLSVREDSKAVRHMSPACIKALSDRVQMWEMAAKIAPPETLQELYYQVKTSPQRNFFFLVIGGIILAILAVGICSGRMTKKVRVEEKNK